MKAPSANSRGLAAPDLTPARAPALDALRRDARGGTFVEYLSLVGVVALCSLGAFTSFGTDVQDLATREGNCVHSLNCTGSASGTGGLGGGGGAGGSGGAGSPGGSGGKGGGFWSDFGEGLVYGDFSDKTSVGTIAGQVVGGLIPVVGQAADVRDLIAAGVDVYKGKDGAWTGVGLAAIGFVPLLGDGVKGLWKGARAIEGAAADAAKHADEAAAIIPTPRAKGDPPSTYSVERAGKTLKIHDETVVDSWGKEHTRLRVDGAPPGEGTLEYSIYRNADGSIANVSIDNLHGVRDTPGAGHALKETLLQRVAGDAPVTSFMNERNERAFHEVLAEKGTPTITDLEQKVPAFAHKGYDYKIEMHDGLATVTMTKNGTGESRIANPEVFQSPGFGKFLDDNNIAAPKGNDVVRPGNDVVPKD